MSKLWSISVAQAKLTRKDTTQCLEKLAVMPLSRRYIVDRMFGFKQLYCIMATYTMHAKSKSIHKELYCQVFGTKKFFVEAYTIQKKSYCHEALYLFIKDYGAPEILIYDSAKEQVEPRTEFQESVSNYGINRHS